LLVYDARFEQASIGQYETVLTEEFLQALCRSAGLTMHVRLLTGRNAHHAVEAIFKAVAVALGDAVSPHPRASDDVPSTKGVL
jgi:imidazoleglycerol-phosphate dehydratase